MTETAEAAGDCALCGRPGTILYRSLDDRLFDVPGTWSLVACTGCTLVWLEPRPEPHRIADLYARYYTHDADRKAGDADGEGSWLEQVVRRGIPVARMGYPAGSVPPDQLQAARLLAWITPLREVASHSVMWLPPSRDGRLLDVGCGSGAFLERMRDLGWQVTGVEPDPRAAKTARERLGPRTPVVESLEDEALAPEGYDAVTLSHVIEHVHDPLSLLRRCRERLAPRGTLVCVTPNTASLGARSFGQNWLHWDPPRHLQLFDPESLERLVEKADLAVRQVSTPASTAHFVWQASTLLERRGRLPGARLDGVSPALWLESVGFWVIETLLTNLGRLCGEEVLVVAERGEPGRDPRPETA